MKRLFNCLFAKKEIQETKKPILNERISILHCLHKSEWKSYSNEEKTHGKRYCPECGLITEFWIVTAP